MFGHTFLSDLLLQTYQQCQLVKVAPTESLEIAADLYAIVSSCSLRL